MEEKIKSIRESLEGIHGVVYGGLANVVGINPNFNDADIKLISLVIIKFCEENEISIGDDVISFIKDIVPNCDSVDSIITESIKEAAYYNDAHEIVHHIESVFFVNQLIKCDKITQQSETALGITMTFKLVLQDLLQLLCNFYGVDYADSDLCYDLIDEMTDLISEKRKEIDIMVFTKGN